MPAADDPECHARGGSRQGGADDQGHDRMSGHAGRRIGVGGRGERKVDAQQCLEAPIGLALDIDDGDNRPLRAGRIGSDGFPDVMGERTGALRFCARPDWAHCTSTTASSGVKLEHTKPYLPCIELDIGVNGADLELPVLEELRQAYALRTGGREIDRAGDAALEQRQMFRPADARDQEVQIMELRRVGLDERTQQKIRLLLVVTLERHGVTRLDQRLQGLDAREGEDHVHPLMFQRLRQQPAATDAVTVSRLCGGRTLRPRRPTHVTTGHGEQLP
jgi:hypothetical protein